MNPATENEPRWVVRGGVATPSQLQAGTARHRGVPDPLGLYGFSVQYQPGKTVHELAVAGRFRNAQISVTAEAALVAAGVTAGSEECLMTVRLYVDFNTMAIDPKERVYINPHTQLVPMQELHPGLVVTLYDEEMEVEAVVEFDE